MYSMREEGSGRPFDDLKLSHRHTLPPLHPSGQWTVGSRGINAKLIPIPINIKVRRD